MAAPTADLEHVIGGPGVQLPEGPRDWLGWGGLFRQGCASERGPGLPARASAQLALPARYAIQKPATTIAKITTGRSARIGARRRSTSATRSREKGRRKIAHAATAMRIPATTSTT